MGSSEIFLFAGLLLAGVAVYLLVTSLLRNNNDEQSLSWATGTEPEKSKFWLLEASRPLVHQFTLKHALHIKSKGYRKRVEKRILNGGLSQELNTDEFIGLQILWGVMTPIFFFIMNFALDLGFPQWMILSMIPLGILLPHIYAKREKNARAKAVLKDLPFFLDLLALSTEAGLDFIGAVQRITEKSENSVLANELSLVLRDIKLGSARSDAMKAMAHRLDVPEITSFVSVLVDADSTGASIAQVLKDQSEQMRLERFVRAEKAGAQASQAILLPLMIFILPAVFIMVFGPVILQFYYGGR